MFIMNGIFQASQIAHLIRDYTHIIVEKQKKTAYHVHARRSGVAPRTYWGGGTSATQSGRNAL